MSELARLKKLGRSKLKLPVLPKQVKPSQTDIRVGRIWVYPKGTLHDKEQGYSIRPTGSKKYPWQSEVWYGNRIFRTDRFKTKPEALDYIRHRKRQFYGGR